MMLYSATAEFGPIRTDRFYGNLETSTKFGEIRSDSLSDNVTPSIGRGVTAARV